MDNKWKLLILYATDTGNAQDVAERIAREATRRLYQPLLQSMQSYEPSFNCGDMNLNIFPFYHVPEHLMLNANSSPSPAKELTNSRTVSWWKFAASGALPIEKFVVFVCSTCGQGDTPAAMKNFWRYMLRKSHGPSWLRGVHYAVFGLGDSGYQKYNLVAKKLDRRLADLGGEEICPKGLGDDQHRSGYEAALDPWLATFWAAMRERCPLPDGVFDPNLKDFGSAILDRPKFRVVRHELPAHAQFLTPTTDDHPALRSVQEKWKEYQQARVMLDSAAEDVPNHTEHEGAGYSPNQPIFAKMVKNERLTADDHEQDVRHIEFDLGQTGLYAPGDILTLVPPQNDDLINEFLKRLSLDGAAYVTVEAADASCSWINPQLLQLGPVQIKSLVQGVLDVSSASPRRYFFEVMSHFARAEHEKEKLQYFASSEGRDDRYEYNQRERRSVLEVLEDFPSVQLPLEWVLQVVPRLKSRSFSIASSPRAHASQAHITLAVVKWKTKFQRQRHGLCSTWLSSLNPNLGEVRVPVWITRGVLKLPPPSVPLILVGPGTGCAPFRSFVEERMIVSASKPVAPILLFFGCRNEAKDFLYRDFWLSCCQRGGVLSPDAGGGLIVAFSRDQPQKVYVQKKIREHKRLVWGLLQSGASIFISGSANKMPAQVTSAFEEIIVSETGMTLESAMRKVKDLERMGKFNVEAWS